MAVIGNIVARLRADTGHFDRGMRKSKKSLYGLTSSIRKTQMAFRRFAGAAMAAAGVAGLGFMIKKQMEAIDVIAKLSDRLGIATEDLIGLQHAASISGVSTEALNKSLEMFVRRLGEMTTGTGEATRGLEMLGLTGEELIRLSPAEAMGIAADRINQLETQAEKAAAAYYLFGRAGAQLVNMFAVGSEGLREFQREAERLNLTLTRLDAKKIEDANDAITEARAALTGLVRVLVIKLAPAIEELADKFTDVITANEDMVVSVIRGAGRIVEALTRPIKSLIIIWDLYKALEVIRPDIFRDFIRGAELVGTIELPAKPKPKGELEVLLQPGVSPLVRAAKEYQAILVAREKEEKKLFFRRREQSVKSALNYLKRIDKEVEASVEASLKRIEAEDVAAEEIGKIWTEMWLKQEETAYHAMRAPIIAVEKLAEESAERRKRISEDMASVMATEFSSAIDAMIFEGKRFADAMTDMLRSVLRMIIKIMVYKKIAEPIAFGIMGLPLPGISATEAHGGGIVGQIASKRSVPALAFAGAPRLHGGLSSDEFPAILQRGEQVIPKGGGGGRAPNIIINNNTGVPFRQEAAPQFNGEEWVVSIVADNVNRGGPLADIFQNR